MKRNLSVALVLTLVLAACGGDDAEETTTTTEQTTTSSSTTTTTTEPTTTTTEPDGPRSPINGTIVDDDELLARRVMTVKIDNHPNARPQSGIQEADAVVEIRVEGGLTRFIAVFGHSDSEYLGPVRSGRPADAAVVRPLDAILAISGGQEWIRSGIQALGVPYISDPRPGMFRISGRFAPHNLYGSTIELREVADERGLLDDVEPPSAWWTFGELPDDAEPVETVNLVFSNTIEVDWTWNGEVWERQLNGGPSEWRSEDGETEGITAETLVVLEGEFFTASPPSGQRGSAVPATSTTGTGRAWVFGDGVVMEGTWERETAEDPFVLTTADGEVLPVPPGYAWISILPDIGEISWS